MGLVVVVVGGRMRNKGVLGSFIIRVCSRLDDVLLSRFVQQNIGEYRLSEKK